MGDAQQTAHDNLTEVKDPVARSKLSGIQESVWSVEVEIKRAKGAIAEKIGAAHAYKMAAERVFARAIILNKQLEEADLNVDLAAETKIRVAEVKTIVALLQEAEQEQRNDLTTLRGQIAGMERAIKALEGRFNTEAQKIDRWERVEAEEAAERVELNTPPAEAPPVAAVAVVEETPPAEVTEQAKPETPPAEAAPLPADTKSEVEQTQVIDRRPKVEREAKRPKTRKPWQRGG